MMYFLYKASSLSLQFVALQCLAPQKNLSNLEQLVMDVLWERGEATAEEIRQSLAKRHFMKESTARTILRRLEEKGYVEHRVDGRTNIYAGREGAAGVAAKAVRQIIDRLCGGSVEQLLVGLIDNEVLDHRELTNLSRKIARRRAVKEK